MAVDWEFQEVLGTEKPQLMSLSQLLVTAVSLMGLCFYATIYTKGCLGPDLLTLVLLVLKRRGCDVQKGTLHGLMTSSTDLTRADSDLILRSTT